MANVTTLQQTQEMFNLTVDEAHTFYIGNNGWLVHNVGGLPCGPVALTRAQKDAYRAEARELWQAQAGGRAWWVNQEIHHRIPLEYAHLFPDADPNRLANLVGLNPNAHDAVSAVWTQFRTQLNGRVPSQAEVMRVALDIDQRFGNSMVFADPSRMITFPAPGQMRQVFPRPPR